MEELRGFIASVEGEDITYRPTSHGNTWSIYFQDPEQNGVEDILRYALACAAAPRALCGTRSLTMMRCKPGRWRPLRTSPGLRKKRVTSPDAARNARLPDVVWR